MPDSKRKSIIDQNLRRFHCDKLTDQVNATATSISNKLNNIATRQNFTSKEGVLEHWSEGLQSFS